MRLAAFFISEFIYSIYALSHGICYSPNLRELLVDASIKEHDTKLIPKMKIIATGDIILLSTTEVLLRM